MSTTSKGIVYPSDYSEIADIPEVMKDMAESIDGILENQDNKIENKVEKEIGKGLSTNDYTNEEKNKLAELENYDDSQIKDDISNIQDDITDLDTNKADKTELPTKTSDLTNDNGFIDNSVNNLINYTLKTNTGSLIDLEINQSTYVITLNLKDQDGNVISTDNIDLPLESVVVGGRYDSTNQKIVLTLENGNTVDIPVGDLVAGLQTEITSSNKLPSDLVDDTNSGNKFTNLTEKARWEAKYKKPNGGIPKTDLASDVQTSLGKADTALQEHQDISGKEDKSNKTTSINENSTNIQYPGAKCIYDSQKIQDNNIEALESLIPTGQANGIAPTLEESANYSFRNVDLGGNTEQKSNLFNNDIVQGAITEGVDATATNRIRTNGYIDVVADTSLPISFTGCDDWYASLYNSSKTYTGAIGWKSKNEVLNIPSNTSYIRLAFRKSDNSNITPNSISNVQIGNVPNPDYPQEVEVVSGDVDVKVQNKNLFDKNNAKLLNAYINSTNKTIYSNDRTRTIYVEIQPNTTYTISKIAGQRFSAISTENEPAINVVGTNIVYDFTATSLTITTGENDKYLAVFYYLSTADTLTEEEIKNSIQIEKGTTATDYVEHEEQNITLPLPEGMELCKIGDYQDRIFKNTKNSTMYNSSLIEGAWYKYKAIGKVVLDGSETYINDGLITNVRRYTTSLTNPKLNDANNSKLSNYFIYNYNYNLDEPHFYISNNGTLYLFSEYTDMTSFKTWLSNNNVEVYYVLATPTYEQITDTDFIEQAELMLKMKSYKDITYVSSDNEPSPSFEVVYYKDFETILNNIEARLTLLE